MNNVVIDIDAENKAISIFLEDTAQYSEWIKGEGADICIYRAINNDRIVGARLPLHNWNGKLPTVVSK